MTAPTKTVAPKAKAPGKAIEFAEKAFHVAWPYAGTALAGVFIGAVTGRSWPALLTLGAVLGIAVMKLHEAWGWHRKGGKAAARARRKYQGHASRREVAVKLSARTIRKRAHITRPGTDNPRQLPADELGVLIGTTVRRPR